VGLLSSLGYILDVNADVDNGDGLVGRVELGVVHGDADAVPFRTELAAIVFSLKGTF
jgi:hypothetical protein